MSSISSLSIKPSNPPLPHQKTETVLRSTKSPIWNSNCVKSQDSINQTFNNSNSQTKPSEAMSSRPRPSEVSGPSATGGHHQSSEGANRNEKPAQGNIIDAPTLEGVSSFFTDISKKVNIYIINFFQSFHPPEQGFHPCLLAEIAPWSRYQYHYQYFLFRAILTIFIFILNLNRRCEARS